MKPGYFARIILKPQSPLWIPPVSRSQVFPDSLGDPPERRSWAGCRWRWFLVWAAWQSPLASEDSASCLLGQLPSCQGLKLWRKLSKHVGRTGKIRRTQQHRLRRSYCSCFFASHIYPAISRIRLFYLWKMSTNHQPVLLVLFRLRKLCHQISKPLLVFFTYANSNSNHPRHGMENTKLTKINFQDFSSMLNTNKV